MKVNTTSNFLPIQQVVLHFQPNCHENPSKQRFRYPVYLRLTLIILISINIKNMSEKVML